MSERIDFQSIQRQLELTLSAIFGVEFSLYPTNGLPYLEAHSLYIPRYFEAKTREETEDKFLMCAIHLAAHQLYSEPLDVKGFNNRQKVLVGVIEDARVEWLVRKDFPGIDRVICSQLSQAITFSTYFDEMAFSVAKAIQENKAEDVFASKYLKMFLSGDLCSPEMSKKIGLAMANDIGQLRISMNERDTFQLLDYRDDNSFLWKDEQAISVSDEEPEQVEEVHSSGISFEETEHGRQVATHAFGASRTDFSVKAVESHHERYSFEPEVLAEISYPEWDYRIGHLKQAWCVLHETQLQLRDKEDATESSKNFLAKRLFQIISRFQFEHHRQKRQKEGGELDIDALVDASVQIRSGRADSEQNIYIHRKPQSNHEFSVLVLLDLSESMNHKQAGGPETLLSMTLDACEVLIELLELLGHDYQVDGFNSDGRLGVNYLHMKSFGEGSNSMERDVKAKYSTRLGVALRHAYSEVKSRPAAHPLILVITDGQPSDIDVHDPNYLVEDVGYAVKEIESSGCKVFCLSLDSTSDGYLQRIFRRHHYSVLDHPAKMTEMLVAFYLKVFKSFLK